MSGRRVKRLALATLKEEVAPAIFSTARVRHGGRHYRLTWTQHGRTIRIVFPTSPSDFRWFLNFRACVRRAVRRDA